MHDASLVPLHAYLLVMYMSCTYTFVHAGRCMCVISHVMMSLSLIQGAAPRRIWSAIFDENCFHGSFSDMCFEQRVFYRLMSGLRASIAAHIASNYPV